MENKTTMKKIKINVEFEFTQAEIDLLLLAEKKKVFGISGCTNNGL